MSISQTCEQLEQEQDKSYSAGAQSQMSVRDRTPHTHVRPHSYVLICS